MVITGSAVLVEPGSAEKVVEHLKRYSEVTYYVTSDAGTELIVNLEADDFDELEGVCLRLKNEISEIVDVAHIYANFEEEIEKIQTGNVDRNLLRKRGFFENYGD